MRFTENRSSEWPWKKPYYVISEEPNYPEPKQKKPFPWGFALVFGLCFGMLIGSYIESHTAKPKTDEIVFTTSGGFTTTTVETQQLGEPWGGFPFSYKEATLGVEFDAAQRATDAWSKALGVTLTAPRVILASDQSACNGSAYACAWIGTDIVAVPTKIPAGYETQVFLHEIGHLLGIEHLNDDPLMNHGLDQSKPPLTTPSKAAIALAKTYRMWKDPRFPLK